MAPFDCSESVENLGFYHWNVEERDRDEERERDANERHCRNGLLVIRSDEEIPSYYRLQSRP